MTAEQVKVLRQAFVDGVTWATHCNVPNTQDNAVRAATYRYPMQTVVVPRIVRDEFGIEWRFDCGELQWRSGGTLPWLRIGRDPRDITVERVRCIAEILENPIEHVPADDPRAQQ